MFHVYWVAVLLSACLSKAESLFYTVGISCVYDLLCSGYDGGMGELGS